MYDTLELHGKLEDISIHIVLNVEGTSRQLTAFFRQRCRGVFFFALAFCRLFWQHLATCVFWFGISSGWLWWLLGSELRLGTLVLWLFLARWDFLHVWLRMSCSITVCLALYGLAT